MVSVDDFYNPDADEIMSQSRDFRDWLESQDFEYTNHVTVWKDRVFLVRDESIIRIFGRSGSDSWELLTEEELTESDALEWYRGVMSGSRNPLDLC